ncbi:helix-turn-helix domain-containing protein [Phenylobacterium sp.]|jgi:IclR family mhp operon transcriptional activator|uniref:helix-turn-helix domain-containing protein n=1 Tax=Phenylobacterium sp. TaxID=1871053 RepID=UPI002F41B4DB
MNWESPIRALGRGLAVIEALNQNHVTTLAALHADTGLPKPSLVRLLETLIDAGYVVRVSRSEGYALTEAVLRLASGVRHRDAVVDVARPLMEAFTRRHKWQVSLATGETDHMLVRFSTRHISPFSRERNFLNRRVPMLQSAVGRAYFAYCPDAHREAILRVRLAAADVLPVERNPQTLALLVSQVRADGFATTERPRSDSTRSFAVPVMDCVAGDDGPVGALAFFYYRSAMTCEQATQRYLPAVRELAGEISEGLARVWPAGRPPGGGSEGGVSRGGIGGESPAVPEGAH